MAEVAIIAALSTAARAIVWGLCEKVLPMSHLIPLGLVRIGSCLMKNMYQKLADDTLNRLEGLLFIFENWT
jgi:hypothetical protein